MLVAAYKMNLQTSGGSTASLNHPPSFYTASQTPTSVIAASTIYTAGELADTKIVGAPAVSSGVQSITAGTNRRGNVLFVYDSSGVAQILGAIRGLVVWSHFVDGNAAVNPHQYRLYLYNEVTPGWVQIDSDNTTGGARTMQGQVASNLADYIDGSSNVHLFLWDWEGTRNPGAGCAVFGTRVGGRVIEDFHCGDSILSLSDGHSVERCVADMTTHFAAYWDLIEIGVYGGSVSLTEQHRLPIETGPTRALHLKVGDRLRSPTGFDVVIEFVRPYNAKVALRDLSVSDATGYFVGPGAGFFINEGEPDE